MQPSPGVCNTACLQRVTWCHQAHN